MKKKLTNKEKVINYIKEHPFAKPKQIAKELSIPVNTVYQAKYSTQKDQALTMSASPAVLLKYPSEREKYLPKREKLRLHQHPLLATADNVNHPPHYKTGGIETIDFIEAKSLNYNLGNVVKYITRADHKGNKLEDLKKAQWYLNREVGKLSKK
jgi:hypothetical protein